MKKKIEKIISLCIAFALNSVSFVYASATVDDVYKSIYTGIDFTGGVFGAAGYIAGWIYYIAIIICVVVLMIKGIKFVTSAPEGKADVKKELIPWFIGLVLLISFRLIINWIALRADELNHINYD